MMFELVRGENMTQDIMLLESPEFGQVRMIYIGEKEYFIANDVAKALGYAEPKNAIARHCKGALKQSYLTNGGEQEVKVIPEGDVYRLIIRSKLPKAVEFEKWLFDNVLPSIRKQGIYIPQETMEQIMHTPDMIVELVTRLKEERDKRVQLEQKMEQKNKLIVELEPNVDNLNLTVNDVIRISINKNKI